MTQPVQFARLFVVFCFSGALWSFVSYQFSWQRSGRLLQARSFHRVPSRSLSPQQIDEFKPSVDRTPQYLKTGARVHARKSGIGISEIDRLYRSAPDRLVGSPLRTSRRNGQKSPSLLRYLPKVAAARQMQFYEDTWRPRLRMPINRKDCWLSSPWGPRRRANGKRGFHYGVDFAAPKGTPIRAAQGGFVVFAGWHGGYGKVIVIDHGDGLLTLYAHLSKILISCGDEVTIGKLIGKVGNTGSVRGRGDGSHLHLGAIYKGRYVNPFYFLTPSAV
ncbi:MAG: M23 family metallopeptidase [Candidatus Babeliaceae bacterium]|nr:M23 family metallopeptidase [Candidatus Babeliaceae bacterium]